jgi:hypothetical protein
MKRGCMRGALIRACVSQRTDGAAQRGDSGKVIDAPPPSTPPRAPRPEPVTTPASEQDWDPGHGSGEGAHREVRRLVRDVNSKPTARLR